MKPCPACRIYNTNNAESCHQCGTPFPLTRDIWPIIIKTATAVLVVVVLAVGFYSSQKNSLTGAISAQEPAALELISSEGFPTISEKMLVEGRVRNISGVDMKKVYVVVSWFNKAGQKVESNSAPVSTIPLPDRHDTSFRVVMNKNPKMENYEISFFDASGNILRVIDTR